MIQENALQQKCESLYTYPILKKSSIDRLMETIKPMDDWNLFRINPLLFAKQNNFEPSESIELFIHGSKVGLFDFRFNMVCPMCGGVASSHESLNQVESQEFYCASCNANIESTLDDQVEVTFAIHPSIKKISLNPIQDVETYFRYHFSSNFEKSAQLKEYIANSLREFHSLESDQTVEVTLDSNVSSVFQIVCIEKNTNIFFHFKKDAPTIYPQVDLLPSGFSPREMVLPLGIHKIQIKNRSREVLGIIILSPNMKKLHQIAKEFPTYRQPYFSAKMLLNTQSFRDLYRTQDLSDDLSLNIKSLTIMFTDLRGSTEMYDRAGDILAYQLVQEHFKILIETVRKYSGTVVKTMGDAIMATFSNPEDGFLTSLEMMTKIESMNIRWREKGYEIGLKVGIHEGSALAVVNDERLDYFGHTVNVAARVQGLAKAGEVWITDRVFSSYAVENLVSKNQLKLERNTAMLKGIGEEAVVYKLTALVQ
jgi:class 3 adenylate cyclase